MDLSDKPAKDGKPVTGRTRSSNRRSWRSWTVGITVLLALVGATFLLSQRRQNSGQGTGANASGRGNNGANAGGRGRGAGGAVSVGVAAVQQGDIGVYINALGTVTPVYTVTVTSRVVGQLESVNYKEGQIVHKGELLAVVDPRPYQAVLIQARGQLARDQALLKNANIDLDRYKMIYAQKAIPEQTVATQQATVEQDQGTVELDQGNLAAAQVNVEYSRIVSPIDGRVGLRLVDPGNIVQANGTTALATITQLQPITVIFTVAEDYLSELTSQLRARHALHVDALDRSNQIVLAHGTLLTIDNTIDPTTGTVRARASFPNKDYRLFPNEFVNARLLVRMLRGVNLIPTAAIQRNNDQAFVYVVTPDSKAQSRNLTIATTDGLTAAVTGVKVGERLVVDGFDRLQDGVQVAVRKTPAPNSRGDGPGSSPAAAGNEEEAPDHRQPDSTQQHGQQSRMAQQPQGRSGRQK